jgi:uncharacterized RDD family membrane protein YckC
VSAQWQFSARPQPTVEYASWGLRALALLIDGVVAFGCLFVAALPLSFAGYAFFDSEELETAIDVVSIVYAVGFLLIYFPLTMRRAGEHNGQTLGKQTCGIRVVRADGQPVDARLAIQREVLLKYLVFWVISVFLLLIPAIVNYLRPLWDEHNQALHDRLAGTFVVKDTPIETYSSGWEPPVPPSPSGPVQWKS